MNPQPIPHSCRPLEVGIVHDLGNLIQVAASALNIVARNQDIGAAGLDPVVAGARTSLEQAAALVRQTLSRGRAAAPENEEADVAACLSEIEALIRLSEPRLVLAVDVGSDLPRLRCDPVGLRSALLNLLFNACEAMPNGGRIAVLASQFREGVEIRVADNGVGMSSATIERAFDPFFTTKSGGLGGVGLPMVEHFVRKSGGTILIESAPGAGTIVVLRMPSPTLSEESDR